VALVDVVLVGMARTLLSAKKFRVTKARLLHFFVPFPIE